jgi:hypothetical protein
MELTDASSSIVSLPSKSLSKSPQTISKSSPSKSPKRNSARLSLQLVESTRKSRRKVAPPVKRKKEQLHGPIKRPHRFKPGTSKV